MYSVAVAVLPIVLSSFQRAPWGWATLALLIAGYFRLKPLMTGLANNREANLLKERAVEMAGMRKEISRLGRKLALNEEELRVVRHDLANANQSFDMFIALVETDPARAAEHAKRIKERRRRDHEEIMREKALIAKSRARMVQDDATEDADDRDREREAREDGQD